MSVNIAVRPTFEKRAVQCLQNVICLVLIIIHFEKIILNLIVSVMVTVYQCDSIEIIL